MSKKILLVDNSLVIRRVVKRILSKSKLSALPVLEAENGLDALEQLNADSEIGIVFLDINMPIMDGFEFLDKFALHPRRNEVEVIVCSTEGSDARDKELEELGVSRKVLKPIRPEKILAALDELG